MSDAIDTLETRRFTADEVAKVPAACPPTAEQIAMAQLWLTAMLLVATAPKAAGGVADLVDQALSVAASRVPRPPHP